MFQKALAIKESVLGVGNPMTAREINRIGNCWKTLGDPDLALVEYHKALALLDEDHAFFDMIQDNITSTQQEN